MAKEIEPRRKWIGVTFSCCGHYGRAYINKEGTEYKAQCPKCMRWMRFVVGPGGSSDRFFSVH